MKIVINHDSCQHAAAYADRCLAATMRNPLGHERVCMAMLEDDGKDELTVTLTEDGKSRTLVLSTDREKELAASLGWLAFEEENLTGGRPKKS